MRADLDRRGGGSADGGPGAGGVLIGVALLGSLVALTMLAGRYTYRAQESGRQPREPPDPERDGIDADEETIPVLEDVVSWEELRRGPGEPPVLTDEVAPGRR